MAGDIEAFVNAEIKKARVLNPKLDDSQVRILMSKDFSRTNKRIPDYQCDWETLAMKLTAVEIYLRDQTKGNYWFPHSPRYYASIFLS